MRTTPAATLLLCACVLFAVPPPAGAAQAACHSTVTGRLDILPLTSRIFGNTRNLRVWLPPGYGDAANAGRKYPVLYMLDGQDLFDRCTASNGVEWRVDEILTASIQRRSVTPIIVVGIDSLGDQQRMHEYLPWRDTVVFPSMPEPAGNQFPDFLGAEVLPLIAAHYRVESGPQHTALGGASYAAIAVLHTLIERPDWFGQGIVESPALQAGNGQLLRDSAFLAAAPRRLFLSMGTNEVPGQTALDSGLVAMFQALARNLDAAYLAKPDLESVVDPGGTHDEKSWSRMFERAVVFLFKPVTALPAK